MSLFRFVEFIFVFSASKYVEDIKNRHHLMLTHTQPSPNAQPYATRERVRETTIPDCHLRPIVMPIHSLALDNKSTIIKQGLAQN